MVTVNITLKTLALTETKESQVDVVLTSRSGALDSLLAVIAREGQLVVVTVVQRTKRRTIAGT